MTVSALFKENLRGKTTAQLNAVLEGALDDGDLGRTNAVLEAFIAAGRAHCIAPSNIDEATGPCASICRVVKAKTFGRG